MTELERLHIETENVYFAMRLVDQLESARQLHRKGEMYWKKANEQIGAVICDIDDMIRYFGLWPKDRQCIDNDTRISIVRELLQ
jgi:hypothetical protein